MKQKLFKQILACILSLAMLLCAAPIQVFAAEATEEETIVTDTPQGDPVTPEEGDDGNDFVEDGEGEDENIYAHAIEVSNAEALEAALQLQERAIRITADFVLDRTFYITSDTAIFTDEAHTLTRAANFGGDIFVVGEAGDGTACETPVVLTLGHPDSKDKDLLTIDGNKDNMSVSVTGSVLFILGGAKAELYENMTVCNHKKVGNEKTLTKDSEVSYAGRVGGAVAIIIKNAAMDIYGGTYSNNSVNDITDSETEEGQASTHGGAFYNYGVLNVYGGVFENNHAARGGVFYCYRTTRIYNAQILNNSASTYGGAVYMPNSTGAFLFIGGENTVTDSRVLFQGNTAATGGGAVYARNKMEVQDAQFIGNTASNATEDTAATAGSGGAVMAGEMELTVSSTVFENNTAAKYGGAIYYAGENGKEDVYDLTCVDVVFRNNSVSATAGALYMNGAATANMENVEFASNTSANYGGAVYLNDGHLQISGGTFTGNSATNGGAAYLTNGASLDVSGGSFTSNSGTGNGGAIGTTAESSVRLNEITGSLNTAKLGGFVYCEETSSLHMYDSTVQENSATGSGGAVHMVTSAFGGIYNTTFHKNISGSNGGALYIYTSGYDVGNKVVLHSCTYTENEGVYGGAIYTAKQSVIDLLNSTAKYNKAKLGGFMYHTAYDTTVNLASLILEGNTATDGGPIIYGNTYNAELNLDKALYIDRDHTGEMDEAYWTYAIANKMTVNEVVLDIPNYIGYDGTEVIPVVPRIPVDITSADELEAALEGGKDLLHITADFTLDRTFYIWRNTTIYTTEAHTLTRAADFGGDIFVVGERTAGEKCKNAVALELGDPDSKANNLLTIDGNKANMTASVTGTVIFVVGGHSAKLYPNLTVTNCKKVGNEKTLTEDYTATVSYPDNVGGAVAILTGKSSMDIFGGIYSNNETNDITKVDGVSVETSTHGGAFYNYGTLNVYGGIFEGNHASRGGVFYCYRTTNIYNAHILNNTASTYGGAIYMPNSTSAFLNLGGENELAQSNVLFQGNSAPNGGAIYAKNKLVAQDTRFVSNSATTGSGGVIYASSMELVLTDTVFTDNTAAKYGAAIYYAGANDKEGVYDLTCENVTFSSNSVSLTGGAIYMNGNAQAYMENVEFTSNSAQNNGGAIYLNNGHVVVKGGDFTQNTASVGGVAALVSGASFEADDTAFDNNSSTGDGGVVSVASSSNAVFNEITATENSAGAGGFAYVTGATLTMYHSRIESNTSSSHGGGIYMHTDASGSIYATAFVNNEVTGTANGGALALYTGGGEVIVHSCSFTGNTAKNYGGAIWVSGKTIAKIYNITAKTNSAGYGGFMYHTAAGTVVDLVGATVSGNTDTNGGPIIWGNTYNAVLNIDKSKFVDEDHTGALGDAYWSAAIVNKLTVNDVSAEIPKWLDYQEEAYEHMASAVDVSNAQELEAAILSGAEFIRVIADFTIDRTFYINSTTTIFSTLPRTLTRAADFGGDIFVIGEDAQGKNAILQGSGAKLTLGNPLSTKENLLTIDGNKDNMSASVVGSALFICNSGIVELYSNVTVQNMYKVGNEKAYGEVYGLSRPNRVGGAMAVVALGTLNIYGGNYRNNLVNDEDASTEEGRNSSIGGLVYNNSNLHIYGGLFENNRAGRGGITYTYGITRIFGGSFVGNSASVSGGVLYAPNAARSHTHIGSSEENSTQVLFQNNYARSNGGAICTSALCTLVIHGNTTFESNSSTNANGGAIATYGQLTVRDTIFTGNTAKDMGGALYTANSNGDYVTRVTALDGCTFENNQGTRGGAMSVYSSNSEFENGAIANVKDCTFNNNIAAAAASKTTVSYGGAIYVERKSSLSVTGSIFTENQARTEGGAIYAGGASTVKLADTDFKTNTIQEKGSHGGAVSIHSVTLEADGVNFTSNTAAVNGGALYISYASAYDRNSEVLLKDVTFSKNAAQSLGGAMYVTKRSVTEEKPVLTANNTTFSKNTALSGGAAYICTGVQAYLTDSTFTGNIASEGEGGAIATAGGVLELDTAAFTGNTAVGAGGGIYLNEQAQVVLYNITAQKNATEASGGFAYCTGASLTMYDSTLQGNTAAANGGGVAVYGGAEGKIYNTSFTENKSEDNGGAVFLYTNLTPCVLHSCTFTGNSGAYGGAIYASNKTVASLYNLVARNNASAKGGFLYETTTDTDLTLAGITVSGNTATSGGPVIWGNSTGAVLHIDKGQFTDEDHTGEMDETYWAAAIYNKLTVEEIAAQIPACEEYVSKRDDAVTPPTTKQPVPVEEIFNLAQNSSDGYINSIYDKFPRLDNSSNFMSKNVTTFENINGGTVTVDTFVYPTNATADNTNVGLGLLVYQAMCYKKAFPEEEVHIDVSSYRFSVQAAVNINRNSRYFGYMRQLSGTQQYDQFGFVRIAYLLASAAKMGIHVTAIGHIDAYPISSGTLDLDDYFAAQMNDPCDPVYVENGVIGDYLTFCQVDWSLDQKGGTDMMHTKLCAVSHYLDMNGVSHRNAVWTGSSNLDGITSKGLNANWKLQSATIVSGHEEIYQASVNYLRLILEHPEQEGIYEFQEIVNRRSTQQAQMILSGRESEIPEGQQIIYLGSENDQVFELYFTPMGGEILAWNEVQNPYCKYMRKLYDSEDYILFTWNAAEYSTGFAFGDQLEQMLIAAFHDNRNVNNRIYGRMENFDASTFDDLEVGVDIGYKSFNSMAFGEVHNKDLQFSYVENGQRYYVSLLNSMNFHSGSMYYQSNFALVIKETDCMEDSVFFALADLSTTGIVEHDYGEEQKYLPEDETKDGYTYMLCQQCDKQQITGILHRPSDWIIDREATEMQEGIRHKSCKVCGILAESSTFSYEVLNPVDMSLVSGQTFTAAAEHAITLAEAKTPLTFEAVIQLPTSYVNRGGVIVSNYVTDPKQPAVSLELYSYGRVRLYGRIDNDTRVDCIFNTDVRSGKPVHIAVTVDGTTATLYVDGIAAETQKLSAPLPENTQGYFVGGDSRTDNPYYFKGTIYSVSLFSTVRTAEQIFSDRVIVPADADGLLYSEVFFAEKEDATAHTSVTPAGMTFDTKTNHIIEEPLESGVRTFEATVQIPKALDSAGVILGNYGSHNGAQIFLDIRTGGCLRLHFTTAGGQTEEHILTGDIRSDAPVHIAVTVSGKMVTAYINGETAGTAELTYPFPTLTKDFKIGGDNREGNTQYFQGTIYSVNLFSDVRNAREIRQDLLVVPSTEKNLVYSAYFIIESVLEDRSSFTSLTSHELSEALLAAPKTIEAVIQIPADIEDRVGVIFGNYNGGNNPQLNLEVYNGGKLRLFYVTETGTRLHYLFSKDLRSDAPVYIAVTLEDKTATLYVDGQLEETLALAAPVPAQTEDFVIGGDNRSANDRYFKGNIYSVNLFATVRTEEQILDDMTGVASNTEGLLLSEDFSAGVKLTTSAMDGKTFNQDNAEKIDQVFAQPLKTIEAVVHVSKQLSDRAGVIVGNYGGDDSAQMNLEIYHSGLVRLYLHDGSSKQIILFNTDIRSYGPTHLAITLDGDTATLYVNGEAVETAALTVACPSATSDFRIGGDNRNKNTEFFNGTIYFVSLFSDVRTADEIKQDRIHVDTETDGLLYTNHFTKDTGVTVTAVGGATFKGTRSYDVSEPLMETPHTLEAVVNLPKSFPDNSRGGVIAGNYGTADSELLNLELYTQGRVRLYYTSGEKHAQCIFPTDIRSDEPVHIAVTVSDKAATLYVNGVVKDVMWLHLTYTTATEGFRIGGDHRNENSQFFKGTIYSVSLFSDVRTADEIRQDVAAVNADAEDLLIHQSFVNVCPKNTEGLDHVESDWISDLAPTEAQLGVRHTECICCGKQLRAAQSDINDTNAMQLDHLNLTGMTAEDDRVKLDEALSAMPKTYEITMQLDKEQNARAGLLFGNYNGGSGKFLNLEIYTNGRPRLWYKIGYMSYEVVFKTDIRSDKVVTLAFVVDGLTASLYVDGKLMETAALTVEIPVTLSDYYIGTDNRLTGAQPFLGTIYAVNLFSDVRTPEELAVDAVLVSPTTEDLLFSRYFTKTEPTQQQ